MMDKTKSGMKCETIRARERDGEARRIIKSRWRLRTRFGSCQVRFSAEVCITSELSVDQCSCLPTRLPAEREGGVYFPDPKNHGPCFAQVEPFFDWPTQLPGKQSGKQSLVRPFCHARFTSKPSHFANSKVQFHASHLTCLPSLLHSTRACLEFAHITAAFPSHKYSSSAAHSPSFLHSSHPHYSSTTPLQQHLPSTTTTHPINSKHHTQWLVPSKLPVSNHLHQLHSS